MFKNLKIYLYALLLALISQSLLFGQIKLPKLISDGMVLQQNEELNIWGWAKANEEINIQFVGTDYSAKVNSEGEWSIKLPKLKAGGPYEMNIFNDESSVTVKDIMIGEVWLCSGQSNMEINMQRVSPLYGEEIANCENPNIRYFEVPDKYNFHAPQKDLSSGKWTKANPKSILRFSAVSYFFGKEIYDKYKVPVGLINAALGGSPIQCWISEDRIKEFPKDYEELQKIKNENYIKEIQKADQTRMNDWYLRQSKNDLAYSDPNINWKSTDFNSSDWETIEIPGNVPKDNESAVNGVFWLRKEFVVSSDFVDKEVKLNIGRIVDADSTFVNGTFVGNVTYEYPPRRYTIPAGVLKEGKNVIVVRLVSNIGQAEFVKDKPYEIVFGNQIIDLKGKWQYKLGVKMEPLQSQTFIRWKPVGLYNKMIAPLLNYKIRGAVWYQGESNADEPGTYLQLLSTLINNWREEWGIGDFPFITIQLPNFMKEKQDPSESNWAIIREAQLKTLSLPNTGLVVAIDLGEWNDIHPLNKKDVGKRVFLAAENTAYDNADVCYSGPLYKSILIEGGKIILSFTNVCDGLKIKGEELGGFSIAGSDGKFVWAKAKIKNEKVIVWSDKVSNPKMVRYAWADNPSKANLYNKSGLPASPFRTDN